MSELMRSCPSQHGIDAAGISAFLDDLEERRIELHSLMIVRGGEVVAEGWWEPYSADRVHLLYSLSKTFTSSCVGMLVDEGRVDLDRPVFEHLTEIDPAIVPEVYRRVTVRHCLNMATGHLDDSMAEVEEGPAEPDPELLAILADPPQAEPGSVFCYNQRATYLLGAVVRRVTGESLLGFARRRLLDPLGIGEARWHDTPTGRELGYSGLHVTTEAVARLGLLWLGRGQFQGRRLLSEAWFDAATDFPPLHHPGPDSLDWEQGYGFQVWNQRHGYRGDGAFGQFMVMLPEHDTVLVTTAETFEMQAVLSALFTHVLPALDRGGSAAADDALAQRLSGLRIPAGHSVTEPGHTMSWARVAGDLPEDWASPSLEPTEWGWKLRFAGLADAIEVGDGTWRESRLQRGELSLPVVASGGWIEGGFTCQIRVIESPHTIVLAPHGDGVRVAWRAVPLGGADPFGLARSQRG